MFKVLDSFGSSTVSVLHFSGAYILHNIHKRSRFLGFYSVLAHSERYSKERDSVHWLHWKILSQRAEASKGPQASWLHRFCTEWHSTPKLLQKKPLRDSERLWAFAFKYVQLSVSSLEDWTKEAFVKAPGAPPSQVRNMTNWWCRVKTCNGWTTTGDILAWSACPCVIRIETYCVDSACFCWRLKSIRSIIFIQSNLMYWC